MKKHLRLILCSWRTDLRIVFAKMIFLVFFLCGIGFFVYFCRKKDPETDF